MNNVVGGTATRNRRLAISLSHDLAGRRVSSDQLNLSHVGRQRSNEQKASIVNYSIDTKTHVGEHNIPHRLVTGGVGIPCLLSIARNARISPFITATSPSSVLTLLA